LGMQWQLGRVTFFVLWCFGVPALFYYGVHIYESLDVIWSWIYPPYAFINLYLIYTFVASDWNAISISIRKREGVLSPQVGLPRTFATSANYGSIEEHDLY
jgi:hypothetical protein